MHWVDQLPKDTGESINQIARGTTISTGWFSNCKRRGTPIDRVATHNLVKLANYLGTTVEGVISRYKERV